MDKDEYEDEVQTIRARLLEISELRAEQQHGFKNGQKVKFQGSHAVVAYELNKLGYFVGQIRLRLIKKDGTLSESFRHVYGGQTVEAI